MKTLEERANKILQQIESLKKSYNLPLYTEIDNLKNRFHNFYLDIAEIVNPEEPLYNRKNKY